MDRISDFTLVLFEYVKTLKKSEGKSCCMCVNVVRSLWIRMNVGHLDIGKDIEPGQGLFTLTWVSKQQMENFYIGSERSKSDYLNVFWTVCCLANIVYNWFN